ncbi:hypothetical protein EC988_008643, partial [Linderina pennispora]
DDDATEFAGKATVAEAGPAEEPASSSQGSPQSESSTSIPPPTNIEEAEADPAPQDLRSAVMMRQCLPESAWEPDEATATCRQDSRRFTLFLRRHHCRRCGLVFCDACSAQRALLASPVSPAGYYGESADSPQPVHPSGGASCWQLREQRVCNACAQALSSAPPIDQEIVSLPAVLHNSGTIESAYTIFGSAEDDLSRDLPTHRHRRRSSSSSIRICPICDKDWVAVWQHMVRVPGEGWQEVQERHIRECIEDASAGMQGARPHHSAESPELP